MKETLQSVIDRFQALKKSWAQVPDSAFNQDEIWHSGLAIAPVEFSKQLSQFQISLQRENAPAHFSSPTVLK